MSEQHRGPDVIQRVDERFCRAELFGQLNRARAPQRRFLILFREHVQLRAIAVSHRQFRAGRQALQNPYGFDAVAFGFSVATETPGES